VKRKVRKKFRKKSEHAEFLLEKLAGVLDECRELGTIKFNHGIVVSKYGYVLPVGRKWVVRMMIDLGYDDDGDED
jgi:hypothetical protein